MLNDSVRALLDAPIPAVLATVNPDGSPQTSVVWGGRDGDDLLVSTAAGRRKERNLRRDPRASLTLYDPADPLRYAEIRGVATITEDIGRSLAVVLAEQYEGPGAGPGVPRPPGRGSPCCRPYQPDQAGRYRDRLTDHHRTAVDDG